MTVTHKDAAIADGSQQIFLTAVKVGTCGHFLEVFARQGFAVS